jgi:FKBP-type peptidyl-prolyl cis-trans isomerase
VIAGWKEALRIMPVGSQWKLWVPPQLAYGDQGKGSIGPNATIVFEVELLGIENEGS